MCESRLSCESLLLGRHAPRFEKAAEKRITHIKFKYFRLLTRMQFPKRQAAERSSGRRSYVGTRTGAGATSARQAERGGARTPAARPHAHLGG